MSERLACAVMEINGFFLLLSLLGLHLAEWRVKAAQTREQGPPLVLAEFFKISITFVSNTPFTRNGPCVHVLGSHFCVHAPIRSKISMQL